MSQMMKTSQIIQFHATHMKAIYGFSGGNAAQAKAEQTLEKVFTASITISENIPPFVVRKLRQN